MLDRWISVAQRRWAFWLCVFAVLALALIKPTHYLPTTGWDKANHALAFGVMALLGAMAYPARLGRILLALLAYGVLIEILQGLTGYRDSDWHDVVADGAGLLLAWPVARQFVASTLAARRAGAGR